MKSKAEKMALFWLLTAIVATIVTAGDKKPLWLELRRPGGICIQKGCNCTIVSAAVVVKCAYGDQQNVEIREGMILEETSDVELTNGRSLSIQPNAFTKLPKLKRLKLSKFQYVTAIGQAFHNVTSPNFALDVTECNSVELDRHAFKNTRGPMSLSLTRCKYVTINPQAFSLPKEIVVADVYDLKLFRNSFKFDTPQQHRPATKISFQSVRNMELPTTVFPSTADEIRMDDIHLIKSIEKDAFSAMDILSVVITNATIEDIKSGAFSDRTLINRLEFAEVKFKIIRSGAFRAGVNDMSIRYSRLANLESGAIDMTVASVTLSNNEFYGLPQDSVVLHQWNRIAIDHNVLRHIKSNAIRVIYDVAKAPNLGFSFSDNYIHEADANSLSFVAVSQGVNDVKVGSNHFMQKCNCNIESWVRERVGDNASVSWIMDTSHCVVDKVLFNCLTVKQIANLTEGYLGMRNYTQMICLSTSELVCDKDPAHAQPPAAPPNVGPHQYPKRTSYFDPEMSDSEQMEREKRIIVVVCVAATLSLIIVMLSSGIVYARRRGACPKLRNGSLNPNSWFEPTVGMTAATSVSRMSVHEYTGLQSEARVLDIEAHEDAEGELEAGPDGSAYSYHENKATQTLPEELTEEYLKELKDKLNDPDKYTHAKDMIEHLYDLIKVEESCNNNNNNNNNDSNRSNKNNERKSMLVHYDDVKPRKKRPASLQRQPSVNVGTKAPSLEKLLPNTILARPELTDYAQPKDHQTVDQNHLYTELPGDETVPSTSRLTEPVLATLAGRGPQPLPPDVINDHSVESNGSLVYGIEVEENMSLNSSQDSSTTAPMPNFNSNSNANDQRRPVSFLKALGDTFIGQKKVNGRRPDSLLKEYSDSPDVTAHLYSELPEPRLNLSSTKMANRPLPTKPDIQELHPMAIRS